MKFLADIEFILTCTLENSFLLLPLFLISCAIAFSLSGFVARYTKTIIARLAPLVIAESILFFGMVRYLIRWIGFRSLTWGFWYEGGWNFYLPFTAMLGILAGYFLGMAFWKRKV